MIVLDASALVDVVLGRPGAGWLIDTMAAGDLVAPAHQPAEAVSALSRLERSGALATDDAHAALEEATSLPQSLVPLDAALVRRAFALRERVRVPDGLYVALGERLGAAVLTTDRRLARADLPCPVLAPAR